MSGSGLERRVSLAVLYRSATCSAVFTLSTYLIKYLFRASIGTCLEKITFVMTTGGGGGGLRRTL